jgi:hypothetical protein
MKLTLNQIKKYHPCKSGWEKLLRSKGKTKPDDELFSLLDVLKSNGLHDALWCLRAVDGYDKEKRLLAVKYARQVQHLMKDTRSINALDVAERFANGEATREEMHTAYAAAVDAAFAINAPYAAVYVTVWDAADAAWHTADAAWWVAFSAAAPADIRKNQEQEFVKILES